MARTSLKTGTGGSGVGWESAAEPRMRRSRARGKGCAEPGAAAAEGGSALGALLAACPPGEASGWWAGEHAGRRAATAQEWGGRVLWPPQRSPVSLKDVWGRGRGGPGGCAASCSGSTRVCARCTPGLRPHSSTFTPRGSTPPPEPGAADASCGSVLPWLGPMGSPCTAHAGDPERV